MSMRVIAGDFKGRRLLVPHGHATRPTAEQVRLALLDTLAPWLPDAHVLDLFAGSGSIGLEALSRGAPHATFVERDPRALQALRSNVAALGLGGRARVLRADVLRALATLSRTGEQFTVIFLDPPYQDSIDPVLDRIARAALLQSGGVAVTQHLTKQPPRSAFGELIATRTRRFGETTLTFFRAGE